LSYSTEATAIRYAAVGNPSNVLRVEKEVIPSKVGPNEVIVKMKAAPINPADLNLVEGNYGVKPVLPAYAGNEGLGSIIAVGSAVKGLSVDDWVIPGQPGLGTWRTHLVAPATALLKVPKDILPEYLATLAVNPCTAYRLLQSVPLKSGDVIIQNAGNSMVGVCVNQMAAARGIKSIAVIRARPDLDETVERLKAHGAYAVVTDEYLRTPAFKRLISDLPPPKLALNAVGGQVATDIARTLGQGGVMITYGGMSRQPVAIPTSLLIFKDIDARGFWMTRWLTQASEQERQQMLDDICAMYRQQKLRVWIEKHPFSKFDIALTRAVEQRKDRKVLLTFE